MIQLRRQLGFALTLTVTLALLSAPAAAQAEDLAEGVQLLKRGRKDEALAVFQRLLAADLDADAAYEMWKATDHQIWLDMMVEGGEFELIAKRLGDRATLGRKQRQNDDDAIRALVDALRNTEDALERRRIIGALSADHGEYAVPRLIRPLSDPGAEDWRVVAMHALTQMDTDVVMPLVAALGAEDAYLRRNVALVLGYIGDPRAAGPLAAQAQLDSDPSVVKAAGEAAVKCGAAGPAVAILLRNGEDYHQRRFSVLRPFDYSDVVWGWGDRGLEGHPVPPAIYNNQLSLQSYYRAFALEPSSVAALAGIARAYTDMRGKLATLEEAGEDVGDLLAKADEGTLAVDGAGIAALDLALQWSVETEDAATGIRIARALGEMATSPTVGLAEALGSTDGAVAGEAAVALGRIAANNGADPGRQVVVMLGANAGREVVRIAAVIDGDGARARSIVASLSNAGVLVNHRDGGASGLSMLNRIPGVDVILVGDGLPDMTLDQVLSNISQNPVTASTPIFFVTPNADLADLYADRLAGTIGSADDLSALDAVFEQNVTGDRAQADLLAARSAEVLAALARSGNTGLSSVLDSLTSTLAGRPDSVTVPAMSALGTVGNADQTGALVGVVVDPDRSDDARIAAAAALAGIFGRNTVSDPGAGAALAAVVASDAALPVRSAAARALGRLQLSAQERAALVSGVRIDVVQ